MKAVANVIQERRLLEEVGPTLLPLMFASNPSARSTILL